MDAKNQFKASTFTEHYQPLPVFKTLPLTENLKESKDMGQLT